MSLYIPGLTDEFGNFVQGLAGNFGALDGSQTEYGSNENGSYVKFENGFGIARGFVPIGGVTTTPSASFSITSPLALIGTGYRVSFIANYGVFVWQAAVELPRIIHIQHPGNAISFTVFTLSPNYTFPSGIFLSFIAIGRWK